MPKHYYEPGAVRWYRWNGQGDARFPETPPGWKAEAMIIDRHPTTGKPFKDGQWWVKETKKED